MSGKNVWQIFSEETPDVAKAWRKLSEEINIEGILDQKTVYLIRIGIYAATRDPVALRHFVREAFKAGISKKGIQAAALMAWGTGVTVGNTGSKNPILLSSLSSPGNPALHIACHLRKDHFIRPRNLWVSIH